MKIYLRLFCWCMAALFSAQIWGATNWVTLFDERFPDNPIPNQRFQSAIVPVWGKGGSASFDEAKKAFVLSDYFSVVRPAKAGRKVKLEMKLRFAPPVNNQPPFLKTEFLLGQLDQSGVGIQFLRSSDTNGPATIRFVVHEPNQEKVSSLREIGMTGRSFDGDWTLEYSHGLMTLYQGTNNLGSAYLESLGTPVTGVVWYQRGGEVACERMTLSGETWQEQTVEVRELLQRAAQINQEAMTLYQQGKKEDALTKMKESSALFIQGNGKEHYDSANSLANLATIQSSLGNFLEALHLWQEAGAIHEKTLGQRHPHTVLTRFNLGKTYMEQGQGNKAKEVWTRCRNDWKTILGPDHSLVQRLDSILENTPP